MWNTFVETGIYSLFWLSISTRTKTSRVYSTVLFCGDTAHIF